MQPEARLQMPSRHSADAGDSPPFHGSYRPEDVRFLLTPIALEPTGVAEKERLIQSGARHYSEMLSRESLPSARYMDVFERAFAANRRRMAEGLLDLAAIIDTDRRGELTLVSLARAGTPIGVILKHTLEEIFRRATKHYSLSIIRDRGIDNQALRFILGPERRDDTGLVFVDGWTAKGVIARELAGSIAEFNRLQGTRLDTRLFSLTDLAGAGIAPCDQDYLIPSCILNATISGLVSRSVLHPERGPDDFHGGVFYREFAHADRSVWFVEQVLEDVRAALAAGYHPSPAPIDPARGRGRSAQVLDAIKRGYGIIDERLIKPGIGEATRVLLRRVPERLLVRDPANAEVAHLLQLADEKAVHWEVEPSLPYQAISLIKGIAP